MTAQKLDHVQGDILVHLHPLQNGQTIKGWTSKFTDRSGRLLNLKYAEVISDYMGMHRITFDYTRENERVILAELLARPEVINAQFNHFVSNRSTVPNDVEFFDQWQYINTGQSGGTPGADLDIDLAWDFTTGGLTANGDTIVVCIIDDGVDENHPDISPNLWFNYNEIPDDGLDNDENGYVDDFRGWSTSTNDDNAYAFGGHGTPVTGIVGAKGNNEIGVAGVNWDVKLMIVDGGTGIESEVLQAYAFPLEHRRLYNESNGLKGAFVVATNASWGVDEGQPEDSPLWCAFYDSLGVQGIISCGATVNAEFDVDVIGDLPTACSSDYLISVTNMNDDDEKVNGAGYGLTTIDLGAFGDGTWTTNLGGGYGGFGGTSGATPHVTGAVALMYSLDCGGLMDLVAADPGSAALLVRQAMLDGVDANVSLAGRTVTGGRLNVFNSMEILSASCGGCLAPFRAEVVADNDSLAVVSWVSIDTSSTLDLRYRATETETWDTLTDVSSPLELSRLVGCQEYEFQFKATCDTIASEFGRSTRFTTEGCCTNPENLVVSSITDSTASLGYEAIYAAVGYEVQFREAGTATWETITTAGTSVVFENLTTCAEYQYRLRLLCVQDTQAYTNPASFFTPGCGPCTDLEYCASPEMSVRDEWIRVVSIGDLQNSSSFTEGGYENYTRGGPTAAFHPYRNYEVNLAPGFSGNSFQEGWAIFIDLNQDGDFADVGERVFRTSTTSSSAVSGSLTIPATALPGYTRMRVFMEYNELVNVACRIFSSGFGEAEDYCVTIVDAPVCLPTAGLVNDTTAIFSDSTAYLAWEASAGVSEYGIRYRLIDTEDWTELVVTEATNVTLEGLLNCGTYEAQIRSNCFSDEYTSDYSESTVFSVNCVSSTRNTIVGLQTWSIFPNPTNGNVRLDYELEANTNDLSVRVYDQLGRQLFTRSINSGSQGTTQLELSDLAAGVYYLRLQTANGVSDAKRLVVL